MGFGGCLYLFLALTVVLIEQTKGEGRCPQGKVELEDEPGCHPDVPQSCPRGYSCDAYPFSSGSVCCKKKESAQMFNPCKTGQAPLRNTWGNLLYCGSPCPRGSRCTRVMDAPEVCCAKGKATPSNFNPCTNGKEPLRNTWGNLLSCDQCVRGSECVRVPDAAEVCCA
ncbi:PREDICTED: uncharacterized protein LOC106809548 [Priapulus caudatus]|uniref:Uncharacterized protein LOC106809548 n=1 Tax=Priapulus caudatus TaxID=37621 RepID=A0ABM1E7H6_PRICU|nr:PREDICTED: uncharacterized protein LOC106809548 [Priapulus caudatus]